MTREQAIQISSHAAVAEACRAIRKYPVFHSTHEGYAVILEELDEAWEEIKRNDTPAAVGEMVQVAAMALRFIAEFSDKGGS